MSGFGSKPPFTDTGARKPWNCKARLNFSKQIVCECTEHTEPVIPPVGVDKIERLINEFSIKHCELEVNK